MLLQLRKDLQFYPREGNSTIQWIVKDPVGFNHFLFSDEEYFLLKLFDGSRGLKQILQSWQAEFQTRSLTRKQLENTVHRFLADNLLTINQFRNDKRLRKQRSAAETKRFWASFASPYIFRFGSINPRGILNLLELPARLLFHPVTIFTNFVFAAIVFVFFVGHFENVSQRVLLMVEFFSYENLFAMVIVVAVVKILHELGHAMACRNFGGDCFEIGVLFIAFFPTLYCDVSDSWTFREKWNRILVSFAGLYVEIILASIATVCWLTTSPGFANTMFFNIAIMCSINSLLINGNPLLKYDGYYVVSDFFEQPNLLGRSRKQLARLLNRLMFRKTESASIDFWLCLYGVLSCLYRIFVVSVILGGLYFLMDFAGFGNLAGLIILGMVFLILTRSLGSWFTRKSPSKFSLNQLRRSFVISIFVIVGMFSLIPLPGYVYCPLVVEPARSSITYATRDGVLHVYAGAFEQVKKGQLLAEIMDEQLNDEIQGIAKQEAYLQRRLKLAVKLQTETAQAAIGVEQLRNQLSKTRTEHQALKLEKASLSLSSERDGLLKPIPLEIGNLDSAKISTHRILQGTVFDGNNHNLPVRRGQPLFEIEEDQKLLVAHLAEDLVEHLEIGQNATMEFDRLPGTKIKGTVVKIIETDFLPSEELVGQIDKVSAVHLPNHSRYRVVLQANHMPNDIYSGSNGRARISVDSKTAFQKLNALIQHWWR